jgi:hypothetical protein
MRLSDSCGVCVEVPSRGARERERETERDLPTCAFATAGHTCDAHAAPTACPRPLPTHQSCPQVFLGSLREIELERVKEKLSSAIMETCLALTIFRCACAALWLRDTGDGTHLGALAALQQ